MASRAECKVAFPVTADANASIPGQSFRWPGTTTEAALATRPDDGTAAFNLGVALEDQWMLPEARPVYLKGTRLDPENTDAHFNVARLAEKLARPSEALQHLQNDRKLTRS